MFVNTIDASDRTYPVVVIGSGFGSLFFVHRLLQLDSKATVLILERGSLRSWETQLAEGQNSAIDPGHTFHSSGMKKPWNFTIAYGGGTNCWYANTPRLHPSDFRLRTLYGRGQDWPITYEDLEPYYGEAEAIMDISGPDDLAIITPRSRPYPQPPHKFASIDRVMKESQPDLHFALPTARARVANKQRPQCCASLRCNLCPVQAKFTALNGFGELAEDPRVQILVEAEVTELERSGSTISGVRFTQGGREQRVACDLCVLGANAIHSPAILLRSGFEHHLLGRGLNEQLGYDVEVLLDGLDGLDGSTIATGANYSLYDGPFRSEYGSAFLAFGNHYRYGLRPEFGRWRQFLYLNVAIEDELLDENRVSIDREGKVAVHYERRSQYAELGAERTFALLPEILAPLPVEELVHRGIRPTESHLQGTIRMGNSPANSVIDGTQIHHEVRNLIVVGSSVMPTCTAVAPSLTIAAMSLRAADIAFKNGA